MKIIPVDCNYVEKDFAQAYLLVHEGQALFIECNTNYAIPYLKAALVKEGLALSAVVGLLITHIHLDHAGGAGLFLKEFPNSKLYAHPRAARHAIDPSKLIASATAVYGEAFMQKLYGKIEACDASRVVVLEDGVKVNFARIEIETKHLRGHANHHLVAMEPLTKTLFSGDSFGVSYPKVNSKWGLVALASTSPTDFDGAAAIESIRWIVSQNPNQIALTHFGMIAKADVAKAAEQMIAYLEFSMELVARTKKETLSVDQVRESLEAWVQSYFLDRHIALEAADFQVLALDLKVNAQGLHFIANKKE